MRLRLALVLALLAAPATAAQTPDAAPAAAGCSYEECALRVEPGLRGMTLVQGREGVAVGRGLVWGPDIESAVAEAPLALRHAQAHSSARRQSAIALFAAAVLLVGVESLDTTDQGRLGAGLGALGLSLYGSSQAVRAQRDRARAVWEYNATLDRSP